MSKKSRKRNKKILAALALAGGAAMLAKRKKASIADTDDAGIGVTHSALKTPWINKKAPVDTAPVDTAPIIGGGGGGIHHNKPKTLYLEKRARAHLPKGPPGWDNPYKSPIGPGTGRVWRQAKGGRIGAKKGGSVTGIAKRGFGRALMKGKK